HHGDPIPDVMVLVQGNGLFSIAGLGDHFHVRLLVDHGGEAVAHHRMIVGENHPDLLSQHRNHHALRLGSLTRTRVPEPGCLSICHSPPIAPARCRMLASPKPSCAYSSGFFSMPTPSSATVRTQCAGSSVMVIFTVRGCAWRTALLTDSCAMRSNSCSCSGRSPVAIPRPSNVQVTPPVTVDRSARWRSATSNPARRV